LVTGWTEKEFGSISGNGKNTSFDAARPNVSLSLLCKARAPPTGGRGGGGRGGPGGLPQTEFNKINRFCSDDDK